MGTPRMAALLSTRGLVKKRAANFRVLTFLFKCFTCAFSLFFFPTPLPPPPEPVPTCPLFYFGLRRLSRWSWEGLERDFRAVGRGQNSPLPSLYSGFFMLSTLICVHDDDDNIF